MPSSTGKACRLSLVTTGPDFERGVIDIAQASGVAGLRSNTVMFGWPEKQDRLERLLRISRELSVAGKSTVIARIDELPTAQEGRIDVWWRGRENNGDLMLMLAYLLTLNHEWRGARICVRTVVEADEDPQGHSESIDSLLKESRIPADVVVIPRSADSPITELVKEHSADADAVFLGLLVTGRGMESVFAEWMAEVVEELQTTIFVRSAGESAGRLI